MSYYLLHKFKNEVREELEENTLDFILTELETTQITYLELKGNLIKKINELNEIQGKLLEKFKIKLK